MLTVAEFSNLNTIFTSILETELEQLPSVPDNVRAVLEQQDKMPPTDLLSGSVQPWLDLLDLTITPHRLRRFGQENGIDEPTFEALLRYFVGKSSHSRTDREKVDWLATQLFKMREEQNKEPTGWVRDELQRILQGIPFPKLGHEAQTALGEIPVLLDDVRDMESFSQIIDSQTIQRGRNLKDQLDEDFFHPVVLAAIVNYNLVFGKKFHELLEQTLHQLRDTVEAAADNSGLDPYEVLRDDYRSTSDPMRRLSEMSRRPEPQKAKGKTKEKDTAAPAFPKADIVLEKQLKRLGIEADKEQTVLEKWTRDLSKRLKADPAITSLRIAGTPLPLEEWEALAFRNFETEADPTLKGEFARSLAYAIAIILRITEESFAHTKTKEKRADREESKKHYNALFYLLYEGRRHKETLARLALVLKHSGYPDMAQQVFATAEKLESQLTKLAETF